MQETKLIFKTKKTKKQEKKKKKQLQNLFTKHYKKMSLSRNLAIILLRKHLMNYCSTGIVNKAETGGINEEKEADIEVE